MIRKGIGSGIVLFVGICLLSIPTCDASAQQPVPALEEVLSRVRGNIKAYLAALPSFSCTEEITSQELRKDRVVHQMKLNADMRVKHAEPPSPADSLTEDRSILTVDGKPAKKKSYKLPLTISGAFAGAFTILFDERLSSCYIYRLDHSDASPDKPSLVLSLTRKSGVETAPLCSQTAPDSTATVWLDPGTFQILDIETRFPDARQSSYSDLRISYKYSFVGLAGRKFVLPDHVSAEISNLKSASVLRYDAKYDNYHLFVVTMTVLPADSQDRNESP